MAVCIQTDDGQQYYAVFEELSDVLFEQCKTRYQTYLSKLEHILVSFEADLFFIWKHAQL